MPHEKTVSVPGSVPAIPCAEVCRALVRSSPPSKRVVLYSYCFGNYRNEIGNFDCLPAIPDWTCILYTDTPELLSGKAKEIWKVVHFPLIDVSSLGTTVSRERATSKYLKFKHDVSIDAEFVPEIVVHIDASLLCYWKDYEYSSNESIIIPAHLNFCIKTPGAVQKLLDDNPKRCIFMNYHRPSAQEEIDITVNGLGSENKASADCWLKDMKNLDRFELKALSLKN